MIAPTDPRHGTRAGYRAGCRQDCCTEANRAYHATYYRTNYRRYLGYQGRVPAAEALAHLAQLLCHATVGEIARAAGVEDQTIRYLVDTPPLTVRQDTYQRITGITLADITTRVGLTRRIQALMAIGWPLKRLAREAGLHVDTLRHIRDGADIFVWSRVRDQILATYERLHLTAPTSDTKAGRSGIARAANLAARHNWAPPLAWDADTIDDPTAKPHARRPVTETAKRVDLGEFIYLIRSGESPERATRRIGVTISGVERAAKRMDCTEALDAIAGVRNQQRKAS